MCWESDLWSLLKMLAFLLVKFNTQVVIVFVWLLPVFFVLFLCSVLFSSYGYMISSSENVFQVRKNCTCPFCLLWDSRQGWGGLLTHLVNPHHLCSLLGVNDYVACGWFIPRSHAFSPEQAGESWLRKQVFQNPSLEAVKVFRLPEQVGQRQDFWFLLAR